MSAENIQAVAGGDVRPCRFIKISTAADYRLLESDANDFSIGISQQYSKLTPLPGASALHAESGDPVAYHAEGEVCLLEAGSGGFTRGAEIKSDGDGKGVLAATTGTTIQNVGALGLETVEEGTFGKVLVKSYRNRPALV